MSDPSIEASSGGAGGVEPSGESADLATALEAIGIAVDGAQLALIDRYRELLWAQNEVMNLTRHTTFDLFVRRDVLDAVRLAELLQPGEDVVDFGTGGGVPGILLAILRPDVQVSLCETVHKKARAVEQFVQQLDLPVSVYPIPVQQLLEDLRFSSVVSRAVGSLSRQLTALRPNWIHLDRLLAVKGPKWSEERGEARHRGLLKGLELRKVSSYPMPGTGSHSVILQITSPRGRFSPSGGSAVRPVGP
ncbi:MAG: ribosomal RNA small subunit methyltransferase G [Pirellulaceae bacterium]|nr:MAG: ribosomal RNA small subunit methyltransferase G [Pirellulaceae bacterium]